MRPLVGLIYICCLIALVSCESELTTSGTNNGTLEKKLVLNPTKAEWQQYDICTLRARITNMPLEDVNYLWDLDEGEGFLEMDWFVRKVFYLNKVHNVRVKAYDAFTDELLGYDSLRVDIRPPVPFVELTASVVDTTLRMNEAGGVDAPITFTLKCSSPLDKIKTVWNFDDGTDEKVDSSAFKYFSYYFKRVGTMNVRVSAYEKTGLYIGSDTVKITLHFPPFTLESITKTPMVASFLDVGTGHPLTADPLFTNPIGVWVQNTQNFGDTTTKLTMAGSTLHCIFNFLYKDGSQLYYQLRDTITADISEDLQHLRSVRVAVHDTGYLIVSAGSNNGGLHYTYNLKNLDLLAVTPTSVVYRSVPDELSEFLTDVTFRASNQINHTAGVFTGSGNPTLAMRKPSIFAIVIFGRTP